MSQFSLTEKCAHKVPSAKKSETVGMVSFVKYLQVENVNFERIQRAFLFHLNTI